MKCLMPLNQRRVIAEAIDGKRYVEWGGGGTSKWLADNASPLSMVTIEHSDGWAVKLIEVASQYNNWSICWSPCDVGANATKGEEVSKMPWHYICNGASLGHDVYLIDGVVRSECLRELVARDEASVIFLHDTQRDWYDDAIAEAVAAGFVRMDYPEGEDYPGCLLTRLEKK